MFDLLRNAPAEVAPQFDPQGRLLMVHALIAEKYQITFDSKSPICQQFYRSGLAGIEKMLNGGTYMFCNGQLVEYRTADYKGFIHGDDSIEKLAGILGANKLDKQGRPTRGLFDGKRPSDKMILGSQWDDFELDIASLNEGGEFNIGLVYKWSPFSADIQTSMVATRLVCENGLMSTSPFVTYQVPVINEIEENLAVVCNRIKPMLKDTMNRRFSQMADQRANLDQVIKAEQIFKGIARNDHEPLRNSANFFKMMEYLDSRRHLGAYYNDEVFEGGVGASMVPSHLSQFDLYNIITEATTHSLDAVDNQSTHRSLQRQASKLVFDELRKEKHVKPTIPKAVGADHRRAFFGEDE